AVDLRPDAWGGFGVAGLQRLRAGDLAIDPRVAEECDVPAPADLRGRAARKRGDEETGRRGEVGEPAVEAGLEGARALVRSRGVVAEAAAVTDAVEHRGHIAADRLAVVEEGRDPDRDLLARGARGPDELSGASEVGCRPDAVRARPRCIRAVAVEAVEVRRQHLACDLIDPLRVRERRQPTADRKST